MEDLQSLYLKLGDKLFERGNNGEALTYYQKAYETDDIRLEALERIKERYMLPQEENFKQNYAENCKSVEFSAAYEECEIDFILLSDGKYVIFDRETGHFCGYFDFAAFTGSENVEKTFQSVLLADTWEAKEMLPVLSQRVWNNAYIVLNDCAGKFMSFFKLPGFVTLLPKGVHVFKDAEALQDYFEENPGAYLPHVIHAPNQKRYEDVVKDIHQKRIKSGVHSDNVFLSICIPSYNRGKLALEATKCNLKLKYDAEIEILISNNGSYIGKEEYETIRDIKDSRVQYYELERDMGIGCNICNCLENAKGYFAIFFSDEDHMILDQLDKLLEHLYVFPNLGGFSVNCQAISGVPARNSKKFGYGIYSQGADAAIFSLYTGYITGVGFNIPLLKQHTDLLDRVRCADETRYSMETIFPHSVLFGLLAGYCDMEKIDIQLAACGELSQTGGFEAPEDGRKNILSYQIPENIILLTTSKTQLLENTLPFEDYKKFFLRCVSYCLGSVASSFRDIKEQLPTKYQWTDIHIMVYQNCLKIIRGSKWGIEAFDEAFFRDLDEVFFDWLDCRRIRPVYSEAENLKATLRAQIARYYYDHGVPFLEIDFEGIDERVDTMIGQALPSRPLK